MFRHKLCTYNTLTRSAELDATSERGYNQSPENIYHICRVFRLIGNEFFSTKHPVHNISSSITPTRMRT